MKRLFVGLLLLVVSASIATAQPFSRRSSQEKHDGLKQYYEIANFKLGGKYDLADPSKWENGGEGGMTLESLGGGKLRTAYIAVGTPRRNATGEITNAIVISSYYSGDSTDMYEQWVKGAALLRRRADHRTGPPDRHRSLLCRDGRSARHLGRQQAVRRAGHQVPAIQLLRHGAGELPDAARPSEGREGGARHGRLDGRHPDLCLGRDASGICQARSCRSAAPRNPMPTIPSATGPSS